MALPPMNTMDDTDRVERLRDAASDLAVEAADEIERLERMHAQVFELGIGKQDEIERLMAEHDDYVIRANANVCELNREIERLTAALEIIAGRRQCIDNLMSNVDVACAALDGGKP